MATTDSTVAIPSDVPAERSPLLEPLGILVGSWQMEARFAEGAFGPDSPAIVNRDGRTTFEWLDGGFFLIQRWTVDHPAAPNGIAIIGASDGGPLVQQYFDSRGVTRRYTMTLEGRCWTLLRESGSAHGHQRYNGEISDDGNSIDGAWESSSDGQHWHHDFGLAYRRVLSFPA